MYVTVDDDVWLASASQISLFRDCARKWAFRYLAGIKAPQHPAAALGEDVDTGQLQPFYREKRPFDYTRPSADIAASGLGLLPKPGPGIEVQKKFVILSPSKSDNGKNLFGYQGYIDLYAKKGVVGFLPPCSIHDDCHVDPRLAEACANDNPLVLDFKTTSDLKWAKSQEDLRTDIQAQLYAFETFYETRAPAVDLVWVYFQTRGAKRAKRTHLRVLPDEAAEQFQRINETAKEMYGIRGANPNPMDLPPTVEACEAYGGCFYRDRCNLGPAQVLAAIAAKEERTMNMADATAMLAAMRAKKAGAQPAIAGPGAGGGAVPPAAAPSPSSPPGVTYKESWKQATDPSDTPTTASIERKIVNDRLSDAFTRTGPINPPEAALPPAAPVGVAETPTIAPKKRGRPKAEPAVCNHVVVEPSETNAPHATPVPAPPLDYKALAFELIEQVLHRLGNA